MQTDAFILIGGRSSRLGLDKAFVELHGNTLMQRAIDVARDALDGPRITVVAGNSLQFATQAIVADTPFIFDLYENRGPLGGLHAALAYARTEWIFVLACDYPLVSRELIELLAKEVADEYGAVVPEQENGRVQPLCAFYRTAAARPVVEEILERPRAIPPLRDVVTQLSPRIVKFDAYAQLANAKNLFTNINTPDDLERARSIS